MQPAPEPAFFDNPAIDNLIAVTMELGAELWVQRERMRIIEKILAEKGVVTAELIEQYTPSAEESAAVRAERDADGTIAILTKQGERHVDAVVAWVFVKSAEHGADGLCGGLNVCEVIHFGSSRDSRPNEIDVLPGSQPFATDERLLC